MKPLVFNDERPSENGTPQGASELKAQLGFVRPDVYWFANCMEEALRRNDHKGTWEHLDDWYLTRRLLEEVGELFAALLEGRNEGAIRDEAVDVANFAMMIADNAMTKKPNLK